jgi:organic hydroperoxide reductase OsmC/OhrA
VKLHTYSVDVRWAAGAGESTNGYRSYSRNHTIVVDGKPQIAASSDPAFRGDSSRYNPEELLVASLSSCHMLWYLHLASVDGVAVVAYSDRAFGTMEENGAQGGQFASVQLRPVVTIARASDPAKALALHEQAHCLCFIARSVNFPVRVEATIAQ